MRHRDPASRCGISVRHRGAASRSGIAVRHRGPASRCGIAVGRRGPASRSGIAVGHRGPASRSGIAVHLGCVFSGQVASRGDITPAAPASLTHTLSCRRSAFPHGHGAAINESI